MSMEHPEIGMKFASYHEVDKYTKNYQENQKVLLKKERTVLFQSDHEAYDRLKYKSLLYLCKHGGTFRSQSAGHRKSSTSRLECPFKIRFKATKNFEYLEIVEVFLEHENHVSSKVLFPHYIEVRKLTAEEEGPTVKLLQMKCNKKLLQQDIRQNLGKHVTLKDLHNLNAKLKTGEQRELSEAVKFLQNKKGLNVDVSILRDGSEFKALYFSTYDMRKSMAAWPEIVCIDGTYTLLDSNLTVMLMLVEDSNAASEIVAVGLLAAENAPTMKWFLETFQKNHGDACCGIRCFMSDKDMVGRQILRKLFPNKPIYICIFHALQAFKRAISLEKMGLKKEMREKTLTLLERLVYSQSEDEYDQIYGEFCEVVPDEVLDYFNNNWHDIKEEWTVFNMTHGNLNNRTNNRMESMNQTLKQVVEKRSVLMIFMQSFFTFLESHMAEVDARAAKAFMKKTTCVEVGSCEDQYASLLTDAAFESVSNDLKSSDTVKFTLELERECYIKTKKREVSITGDSCSCGKPSSALLPCKHIFAARKLFNLPLYDENLCHERWTKNYYKKHQRIFRVGKVEEIGVRLPLVCTMTPLDVNLNEDRKLLIEPLLNSLLLLASNACRSAFDEKMKVLRIMEESWRRDFDLVVQEKMPSQKDTQPKSNDLLRLMHQLKIDDESTSTRIQSVPNKRTLLKPPINALMNLAINSIPQEFTKKMDTIKTLKTLWEKQLEISIDIVECAASHVPIIPIDSEIAQVQQEVNATVSCEGIEAEINEIRSPASVLVKGKPRLGLITTPKQSRKKKLPVRFIDKSELEQKQEVLSWLIHKDQVKTVLDFEYTIEMKDLNLDIHSLRDSLLSNHVNINNLSGYFAEDAFEALESAIRRKKEKKIKSCSICTRVTSHLPRDWMICDCCLLSYHCTCVDCRTLRVKTQWFCSQCVGRGGRKK